MSTKNSNGYCGAYRLLENAYLERFEELAASAEDVTVAYGDEKSRLLEYFISYSRELDLI